ncbi:hypothetical protein LWI28_003341 [Acer negundo]|uniref:Uncharacterized protein n=1 Tax=Acer negundo TaxID=4023 RepID=A0AAD5J8M0_ACENE|nr:hypothetical protein LWI28_003341 [Acer negundo]
MVSYLAKVREAMTKFKGMKLEQIPREKNHRVDVLAKIAGGGGQALPRKAESLTRITEVNTTNFVKENIFSHFSTPIAIITDFSAVLLGKENQPPFCISSPPLDQWIGGSYQQDHQETLEEETPTEEREVG